MLVSDILIPKADQENMSNPSSLRRVPNKTLPTMEVNKSGINQQVDWPLEKKVI